MNPHRNLGKSCSPICNRKAYKGVIRCLSKMTPRKEEEKEQGILEQMLRRLKAIGTNVEEILDKVEAYASRPSNGYDDQWRVEDLYDNGDY